MVRKFILYIKDHWLSIMPLFFLYLLLLSHMALSYPRQGGGHVIDKWAKELNQKNSSIFVVKKESEGTLSYHEEESKFHLYHF